MQFHRAIGDHVMEMTQGPRRRAGPPVADGSDAAASGPKTGLMDFAGMEQRQSHRRSVQPLLRPVVLSLVACWLSAMAPSPTAADDGGNGFRVFGAGDLTCQRWLEDRRMKNPSATQSEMWVAGYLTAYNQFVHKEFDVTDRYDGDYVLNWIDEYCRKRPPNKLVVAARDLVQTLRRRR